MDTTRLVLYKKRAAHSAAQAFAYKGSRLVRIGLMICVCFFAPLLMASAQKLQPYGGSRRPPVLVDDSRPERFAPADRHTGFDDIPGLSISQRNKMIRIEGKANKDRLAIERRLEKEEMKAVEQGVSTNLHANATRGIYLENEEIAKLNTNRERLEADRSRQIRAVLNKEQRVYWDRLCLEGDPLLK